MPNFGLFCHFFNCQKCNQCLKGHKSLGSLFDGVYEELLNIKAPKIWLQSCLFFLQNLLLLLYSHMKMSNSVYFHNNAMSVYFESLHHCSSLPAPEIAVNYWKLSDKALMRDVILAIRQSFTFSCKSLFLYFPCFYVYGQGGRGSSQGGQPHPWRPQPEQAKPLRPWRIASS